MILVLRTHVEHAVRIVYVSKESDIVERCIAVDELKTEKLEYVTVLVLGLRAIVFPVG